MTLIGDTPVLPDGSKLRAGTTVTIQLSKGVYDVPDKELIVTRPVYVQIGSDGSWQADLEPNSTLDPADSYYTATVGVTGVPAQTFTVPDAAGPVWVHDYLVTPPGSSDPLIVAGITSIVAGTNVTVDASDPANPVVSASGGGTGGSVTSADITDATTVGKAVLTAADEATARTAIGAGTSSFDGQYSSLTDPPTLGTAAAQDSTAFDAAGAAATAQSAAESYTDAQITGEVTRADAAYDATGTAATALSTAKAYTDAETTRAEGVEAVKADLVDGLIPTSQLPTLTISNTYEAADESAMLALTADAGDLAIREDTSTVWILKATPASTLGNWMQLGTGSVASINGQTGVVVLGYSDVGAASAAQGAKADTAVQPTAAQITSLGVGKAATGTAGELVTSGPATFGGVVGMPGSSASGGNPGFHWTSAGKTSNFQGNLGFGIGTAYETIINVGSGGSAGLHVKNGPADLLVVGYTGAVSMPSLPTADPNVAGQLWNNAGVLSISSG